MEDIQTMPLAVLLLQTLNPSVSASKAPSYSTEILKVGGLALGYLSSGSSMNNSTYLSRGSWHLSGSHCCQHPCVCLFEVPLEDHLSLCCDSPSNFLVRGMENWHDGSHFRFAN